MRAPDIEFNGVSAEELGLIVVALPDYHRAARRVTTQSIPGSSVPLIMDEGGYDVITASCRINLNGQPLSTLYTWLRGEGWMRTSDEPDLLAYVYFYDQQQAEHFRVGGECYDTVTVQMSMEPFKRIADTQDIELTSAGTFAGLGTDSALPKLTIYGEGDVGLLINGVPVLIDGMTDGVPIVIDSEAGIAAWLDDGTMTWAGTAVTLTGGWPTLNPEGYTNSISWTGDISRVVVSPQWRVI